MNIYAFLISSFFLYFFEAWLSRSFLLIYSISLIFFLLIDMRFRKKFAPLTSLYLYFFGFVVSLFSIDYSASRSIVVSFALWLSLFFFTSFKNSKRFLRLSLSFFFLLFLMLSYYNEQIPIIFYILATIALLLFMSYPQIPVSARPYIKFISGDSLKLIFLISCIVFPIYLIFPDIRPNYRSQASHLHSYIDPSKNAGLGHKTQLDFHIKFFDPSAVKEHTLLYWRTGVLEESSGLKWQTSELSFSGSRLIDETPLSGAIAYDILGSKSLSGRLPSLEQGLGFEVVGGGLLPLYDKKTNLYKARELMYRGYANLSPYYEEPSPKTYASELTATPRLSKLIDELKGRSLQEQLALIDRLMGDFTYTLSSPDLTSNHPIDEFIFESKKGYCEHFASISASLLRASGRASRVVIGYLSESSRVRLGMLALFSSDAHAWVEIWDEGKWHRYDPTLSVGGFSDQLHPPHWIRWFMSSYFSYYGDLAWLRVIHWFASLDTQVILIMSLVLLCCFFGIPWLYKWFRRDRLEREMNLFLRACSKRALVRRPSETFKGYCLRVATRFPSQQAELDTLSNLYDSYFYNSKKVDSSKTRLISLLKQTRKALSKN